jgi:hypothetical protein
MTGAIEQVRTAIASLVTDRKFLTAKNALLRDLCQSMCQECIRQGVEPSAFYGQWGETEVGKEMAERSAQIVKLQTRIDEKQKELSILENETAAGLVAVAELSADAPFLERSV